MKRKLSELLNPVIILAEISIGAILFAAIPDFVTFKKSSSFIPIMLFTIISIIVILIIQHAFMRIKEKAENELNIFKYEFVKTFLSFFIVALGLVILSTAWIFGGELKSFEKNETIGTTVIMNGVDNSAITGSGSSISK